MNYKCGFTKIPNYLLETILTYKCSGKQKELLFAVVRQTLGYHRDSAELALSFFEKMLKQDKSTISKNINVLVNKNVLIIKSEASFKNARIISINLNISEWEGVSLEEETTGIVSTVDKSSNVGVENISTITVDKKSNMKEITKEINHDNHVFKSLKQKHLIVELFNYYCKKNPHPAEISKILKILDPDILNEKTSDQILFESFEEFPSFDVNKQNTSYLAGVIKKKVQKYRDEITRVNKRLERKQKYCTSNEGISKLNLLEQYDNLRNQKIIH